MKRFRLFIFFLILFLLLSFSSACIKTGPAVEETADTGETVLSEEETTLSAEEEETADKGETILSEEETSLSAEEEVTAEEEEKVYSEQEIEYFFEIAFGAEYGSSDSVLHKWANDIRIKINGSPTDADLETLNLVVAELNNLSSSAFVSIVTGNHDVDIYFADISQFSSIEPNYVPGNKGFFWGWFDADGDLFKANILIALDGISQQERSHLIREELTQGTGLMKDSWRYQESIFYQGWTSTEEYSQTDRAIIRLLYDQRLRSGMTQDQVKDAIGID